MGRLADLVGRKEVYITGSLIFVFGAILAGFSPNLTTLVLSRLLQGVGAAMTQGTGMAIITSMFPSKERGKALGLIMTVVGTGAVAGPAMGGFVGRCSELALGILYQCTAGTAGSPGEHHRSGFPKLPAGE